MSLSDFTLWPNTSIQDAIKQYGSMDDEGNSSIAYGVLFDKTANTRESIITIPLQQQRWNPDFLGPLSGSIERDTPRGKAAEKGIYYTLATTSDHFS